MPTIRLVPSAYTRSSTNRVTVTDPTNMYYNTDHTASYCSIRGRNSSSNTYYCFIHGFNFDDVPTNANVTAFTVKIRCYKNSYQQTGTSYNLRLASSPSSSSVISDTTATTNISTSVNTITIPTGSLTWNTLKNYGSNFSIDIPLRPSSNQYPYVYVYGAEIEVTYSSDPRTITSTLTGNGTINPSGSSTLYDGDEYTLTITPTNKSDEVTVTNNGTDVTNELEPHHTGGTSTSKSTASGSEVTTGFARSNSQFYRGNSSTTGDDWLRYAIGKTAESPYSTSNTSNTYCKDGTNDATTAGWMNYPFDFSAIPSDADITAVEVKCYGAAESLTETARHSDVSLWCGSTQKGTTQSFSSTSNTTMTISDPGTWTREELQDAWVRFAVGYYGGRILGITWKVTYTYGGTLSHYTYTYTVNGNATIAVVIGNPAEPPTIYVKINSSWIAASAVYKKINGSWIEQADLTSVFSSGTNYLKGN